MKNYFLIKSKVHGKPTGSVPLAENYLIQIINRNPVTLETIERIFTVLGNLKLNDNGDITNLKRKVTRDGETYYFIEDD